MQGKRSIMFWGLALAAGLILAGAAGATERCVLAELFTVTGTG